jgi:hypothetical protein
MSAFWQAASPATAVKIAQTTIEGLFTTENSLAGSMPPTVV